MSERGATVLLWALALLLPLAALVQPSLLPSRSSLPIIEAERHNLILLVTVPGLRADRVHHLGYERQTTPTLDRLAERGISFENFYASSNIAAATLATVHGGRSPVLDGSLDGEPLDPRRDTLASLSRAAGFATYASLADPSLRERGLEHGFQEVAWSAPEDGAEAVISEALRLVDGAPDSRILLWVDLPDLLPPYGGRGFDPRRFAPEMPADFGAAEEPFGFLDAETQARRGWGERERAWLSDRYDAALHELDASLARLLEALDERMLLATASVCVMGTRGELIDDRPDLLAAHGVDLYERSVHVPLVFLVPARHIRGRRVTQLLGAQVLGPTLLAQGPRRPATARWADACADPLGPELQPARKAGARVFSQGPHARRLRGGAHARPRAAQALRASSIKLVHDLELGVAIELYDLERSPDESAGLARPRLAKTLLESALLFAESCASN